MARRGGFPASKFCDQAISEAYHCLVCFEVCRSPVTCQSEGAHLFCSDCLKKTLRLNPVCPVCRERLTAPIPSPFVAARVSALDVLCVHDKCKWKGTCGRLDVHLDTDCPHEPITCSVNDCAALVPRGEMDTHNQFHCLQSCPNSKGVSEEDTCDVRLSRHDLVDHLAHNCKLRMTRCPHPSCEVSTAYNKMSAHTEICPHAPVACPRQCKALNLTRQTLDAHRRDCPNEPVPCVHAPLGCSHVAPRCEIVQHEQNSEVHLSVLRSKAFAEQQQIYQQQMGEMRIMLEEQTTLIKKQQEQMSKLEALFKQKLDEIPNIVYTAMSDRW